MVSSIFYHMPVIKVNVDAEDSEREFAWRRHTIGHGGINSLPLPERIIAGAKKLKPKLLRTFVQECFYIYPEHGRFDWSLLDPYMDSLAAVGCDVVAAIAIKPKPLFPAIDQTVVMPNDVKEWQHVIYELVKRYSVDKKIVTYWEIANEPDIGEHGGCPYLFRSPEQYNEYYRMTSEAVLAAYPEAKVGGPALASAGSDLMLGLMDYCRDSGVQLDFVSWHLYHNDPDQHKQWVDKIKSYLEERFPGTRPEMLVTEWSKGFEPISIEELAFMPERAAMVASGIFAMMDAGLDWSFYYHIWDQVNYVDEFSPFFHDVSIMTVHWNEIPHRFGMFGVGGEVRPQYFVYQMLSRMGDEQVFASSQDPSIRVRAAKDINRVSVMIVNYNVDAPKDVVVSVEFANLTRGRKMLTVYRIDEKRRWSDEELELLPTERREIDSPEQYHCQVLSPAGSVTLVVLEDIN